MGYEVRITMPKTKGEIRHIIWLYERNGHPGCVGSVDYVHGIWDKYYCGMQALCTGKEKLRTLVAQAVCTRIMRILLVSHWFFGTYNNKTISKYDPVMKYLKDEPFKNMEWITLAKNTNGEIVETK